jgi:hypothetical protein
MANQCMWLNLHFRNQEADLQKLQKNRLVKKVEDQI